MSRFEQLILSYYPYFHRFTLACVIFVFAYKAMTYDFSPNNPSIAWVLEIIAPDFLETFRGGNALDPNNFVTK